jgi:predicted phage-related endonuclease
LRNNEAKEVSGISELQHGFTELGESEFVGFLEDGSDEWHAQRGTGIGSSEIATVANVPGAFKPKYILWLEKMGHYTPPEPDEDTKLMFLFGHLAELTLDEVLKVERPHELAFPAGSWRHKNDHTALANPDRLVFDTERQIWIGREYKNSRNGFEGDEAPLRYVAQAEWCRGSLGFPEWQLVAQYSGSSYRMWTIKPGPLGQTMVINHRKGTSELVTGVSYPELKAAQAEFVKLLRNNTPPPLDGGEETFDYMKRRHPDIDVDSDIEIPIELARELHESDAEYKALEAKLRRLKAEVLELMKDAKGAYIKDGDKEERVAYRQAAPRGGAPTLYLSRTRAAKALMAKDAQASAE